MSTVKYGSGHGKITFMSQKASPLAPIAIAAKKADQSSKHLPSSCSSKNKFMNRPSSSSYDPRKSNQDGQKLLGDRWSKKEKRGSGVLRAAQNAD